MNGLKVTLRIHGAETVLAVGQRFELRIEREDPPPNDEDWRVISLWGMDDRPDMENDPVICFAAGQEEAQMTMHPLAEGEWWRYE